MNPSSSAIRRAVTTPPTASALHVFHLRIMFYAGHSRPTFLSLISTLYRRGAEVLDARLHPVQDSRQQLNVTISVAFQKMHTIAHSLFREVSVESVHYADCDDPDKFFDITNLFDQVPGRLA